MVFVTGCGQMPAGATFLDTGDPFFMNVNARILGSIEQQSIQGIARKNNQRVAQAESGALTRWTDELAVGHRPVLDLSLLQERELAEGAVSETAAAGFLPGKPLFE
jgi:hypothetical protein